MRKGIGAVVAILIAAIVVFVLFGPKAPPPPVVAPATESPTTSNPATPLATMPVAPAKAPVVQPTPGLTAPSTPVASTATIAGTNPIAAPTAPETVVTLPSDIALQNVRRAVRQYGDMFGGNPVGNNQEITSALSGSNPKHINFIDAEAGMRIDGTGQLVDNWGTPYFFHQNSATDMEIRSAGPDKVMWTRDDMVFK